MGRGVVFIILGTEPERGEQAGVSGPPWWVSGVHIANFIEDGVLKYVKGVK